MTKYTIGVDFGTLSGRAVLVEVKSGREVADCVMEYPHAVMDETLPGDGPGNCRPILPSSTRRIISTCWQQSSPGY